MSQQDLLKKANSALLDINRGYSVLNASGRDFYFRHFSIIDVLQMDEEYEKALFHASKSGIKKEEELINVALKRGTWSLKKEEEVKALQWTISKMQESEKKSNDFLNKMSMKKEIQKNQEKIKALQDERHKITSYSAESFAENKRIRFLISNTCFKDRGFSEPIEDDLSLDYSLACFAKIAEFNDKKFILNVAYNTAFFEIFVLHYRQPDIIFKKSGLDLSVFQKSLLVYSNALLNKLKNISIPEDVAKDPMKVLEYEEKEGKKTSRGVDDLKEKMEARGGKLKPEDYLT